MKELYLKMIKMILSDVYDYFNELYTMIDKEAYINQLIFDYQKKAKNNFVKIK